MGGPSLVIGPKKVRQVKLSSPQNQYVASDQVPKMTKLENWVWSNGGVKVQNSTDCNDTFLRRMVAWCCREIGLPVRWVRQARFTNYSHTYRGRAWRSGRILVRIG